MGERFVSGGVIDSNDLYEFEVLKTEPSNGILLDLEMPIIDGLTMLKRLRRKSAPVPTSLITIKPTRLIMLKAMENGKGILCPNLSPIVFAGRNVFGFPWKPVRVS